MAKEHLSNSVIAASRGRVALRGSLLSAAVAAAISSSMGAGVANAQQGAAKAGSIDEVVVTARRRIEDVQSVPQTIDVIGGPELKELGKVTFKDLQFEVPGFYIENYETRATIAMRGIGAQVPGGGQAIASHTNNIYQASTAASLSWVFDIDRVEVLKGPQGTLYGRNSTGGAVNIVTRKPGDTLALDASLEIGNDNGRRIEAAVDLPFGAEWAARIAGTATRVDGRITNVLTNSTIEGNEFTGGRVTLAGKAGAVDVEFFAQKTNETGGAGELIALKADGQRTGDPLYGWNKGYYDEPTMPTQERDYSAAGLTLAGEFGNGYSWKSVTGYLDYSEPTSFLDVNPLPAPVRVTIAFPQYAEQLSQELQLQFADDRLNWVVGALYMDADEGEQRIVSIQPVLPGALDSSADNTIKTTALFGDLNYKMTDELRLNVGLRYNRDEVRNAFEGRGLFDGQSFDLSSTQTEPTGRIGLDYTTSAGTMFYGSVAKGFQSGYNTVGFTTNGTPAPATVEPERLMAYEAGMKSRIFDDTGLFNIAAFYYDYRDMQVLVGRIPIDSTGALIPDGVPFYTTLNAGKAEIYGADVEFKARAGEHLRFEMNGGYLRAKFIEYKSLDDAGASVDYSGNKLPRAPEISGTAALIFDELALGSAQASVRLEYQYRDTAFDNADNRYELKTVSLLNALVSVDYGSWRFWAGGRNLSNTRYWAFYDGRNFGYPGQFRTWTLGASYSMR